MGGRHGDNRSAGSALYLREAGSSASSGEVSSTGNDGPHAWTLLGEVGWWLGCFANKQMSARDWSL